MEKHEHFIQAIHAKKKIKIKYDSKEKGYIVRTCVPWDFGPSNKFPQHGNYYHVLTLDSPDGPHPLPIIPERLMEVVILDEHFEPGKYITWRPIRWNVPRDWGEYS